MQLDGNLERAVEFPGLSVRHVLSAPSRPNETYITTLEENMFTFFVVNEANSSPGMLAICPHHPAVKTATESQR